MGYVRHLGNFTATEVLAGSGLVQHGQAAERPELLERAEALGEALMRGVLSAP
jgi:hypothetical protein